jgi:UDP:flavonoid glycosyltransferase YjiC (YdhE family)
MKIAMQTWGSAGDLRPVLALGKGLHRAGHQVTAVVSRVDEGASPTTYSAQADLAPSLGFTIRRAGGLTYLPEEHRRIVLGIQSERDPIRQLERMMAGLYDPMAEAIAEAAFEVCRGADVAVGHQFAFALSAAAEKAGIPFVSVMFFPGFVRSAHRPPGELPDLGRWLNPVLWSVANKLVGRPFLSRANALRKREGLSPVRDFLEELASSRVLSLIAASPSLSPREVDWASRHHVTGFLDVPLSDGEAPLPSDVEAFLAQGAPPVFVSLGSMLSGDPAFEELTAELVRAIELADCRAIVQAPWDEIRSIPESPRIHRVLSIPHATVFPRCAVVVHHGGAGTAHSATLAGCPSVVVPFAYDQAYWGERLHAVGVGPKPVPRKTLHAEDLARALRVALETKTYRERAAELATAMRAERGIETAVRLIEGAAKAC